MRAFCSTSNLLATFFRLIVKLNAEDRQVLLFVAQKLANEGHTV
jgi:hypothetical protein